MTGSGPTTEQASRSSTVSRRLFLGALLGATAGCGSDSDQVAGERTQAVPSAPSQVVVTTDFAVPHIDPDEYYDVACGVGLGVLGFVLDKPTQAAASTIEQIGGRVLEPSAIREAATVIVIGAATNAARFLRTDQRVVLFAGDADGAPEYNQQLDTQAYAFLRPRSRWVPCFSGGLWHGDRRSSWVQTTDQALLDGQPMRCWMDQYVKDAYGLRNLWVGPLLRFGWTDTWRGHSVASGRFAAGPRFDVDMINGTRELLSSVRARCASEQPRRAGTASP